MDVSDKLANGDYDRMRERVTAENTRPGIKFLAAKPDHTAWNAAERAVNEAFRADLEADLFADTGRSDYSRVKLDLLFATAWDIGHSYGLNEVYIYYKKLQGLIA